MLLQIKQEHLLQLLHHTGTNRSLQTPQNTFYTGINLTQAIDNLTAGYTVTCTYSEVTQLFTFTATTFSYPYTI